MKIRNGTFLKLSVTLTLILSTTGAVGAGANVNSNPMRLWYDSPATQWTEALPVGNGSSGAMVFGDVRQEHIQFNEDTLWTGIAEMLLQSHRQKEKGTYILNVLPALPTVWPDGSVNGLRARGGFEVAISWKSGKLVTLELKSLKGSPCVLNYGHKSILLHRNSGVFFRFGPELEQQ